MESISVDHARVLVTLDTVSDKAWLTRSESLNSLTYFEKPKGFGNASLHSVREPQKRTLAFDGVLSGTDSDSGWTQLIESAVGDAVSGLNAAVCIASAG